MIRPERAGDAPAIFAVHAASFESDAEARLVDRLRAAGRLSVSRVAEADGEIVGHAAFSQRSGEDGSHGVGESVPEGTAGRRRRSSVDPIEQDRQGLPIRLGVEGGGEGDRVGPLTARRELSELLDTRGREALRDTLGWRTPHCRHRYCGDVLVLDEPHKNPSHEVWRCDDCQRVHNGWGDCMEDYRS